MTYNVEKILDSFGYDKARKLILEEGYTQVDLHKALGLSKSNSRLNSSVYTRIYRCLGIDKIPYIEDTKPVRKLKLHFDKHEGRYWESDYISEYLFDKLQNPVVNRSEGSERLVIGFPKHPKANKDSNQIKAHIVLWELVNEQYVPEDCWVVPIDGNYTNLAIENWVLVNITAYKNAKFSGKNNPAYIHGLSLRPKQGGWQTISKKWLHNNPVCTLCNSTEDLVVHHIINYHLFQDFNIANSAINLMTLCRACHTKLHLHNTNIKAHIEETQYSKLLELLETLKSQVPDPLMETYRDVEKQLGLTDNQQPSTV